MTRLYLVSTRMTKHQNVSFGQVETFRRNSQPRCTGIRDTSPSTANGKQEKRKPSDVNAKLIERYRESKKMQRWRWRFVPSPQELTAHNELQFHGGVHGQPQESGRGAMAAAGSITEHSTRLLERCSPKRRKTEAPCTVSLELYTWTSPLLAGARRGLLCCTARGPKEVWAPLDHMMEPKQTSADLIASFDKPT